MKDKITIAVSVLALVFSFASATISFQLQKGDSQRTAKELLSKTVAELIDLNTKTATLWFTPEDHRNTLYYQQVSIMSQKAASLTRQALYIANNNPNIVTDVDFATIAQGLVIVGDNLLADNYWRKAVETSPTNFYKVVNLRGYADFLFRQGSHELARESYQKSLKVFKTDTDYNKATNGYTYQMWMNSELQNGLYQEAKNHFDRAKGLYESISNPDMKMRNLESLNQAMNAIPSQNEESIEGDNKLKDFDKKFGPGSLGELDKLN